MKFDLSALPEGWTAEGIQIGDLYPARGGSGTTRFWLVVAISPSGKQLHMLGIDAGGEVVSTTTYGAHVMEGRPRIGRVNLSELFLPIIAEVKP